MFALNLGQPRGLVRYTPLQVGSVSIKGGPWQAWRLTNSRLSLRHGLDQLRASGTIANFETLSEGQEATHGHEGAVDGDVRNFVDSDVYKWLEAVAWSAASERPDDALIAEASMIVDSIARAQDEDGYLNTWFQRLDAAERFSNLQYGHELYCLGHLIQAGIAWKRVLNDSRLLSVAIRFAELVLRLFTTNEWVCGHPCIEMALVELSRETSDDRFAHLAALLIERRGRGILGQGRFGAVYYQDDRPYLDMPTLSGHAVRAVYLAAGAADVALQSASASLLQAGERQWRNTVARRTHLTGGIGSRQLGEAFGDDFEVSPDAAYCETCAAIGLVMWTWRLAMARLKGGYGDLIERAVYNAIMSGVSTDGRAFHYANPLEVRDSHPRQTWFEIACCPPNLMRTVASLDQLVASEGFESLQLHQYVPAQIAGAVATVMVATDYPSSGEVNVEVVETRTKTWEFSLRIPRWAQPEWALTVNGTPHKGTATDGYVTIRRRWKAGDIVTLRLGMDTQLALADPRTGLVGAVAVERGPIVYCLDESSCTQECPGSLALATDPGFVTLEDGASAIPRVEATVLGLSPVGDWPYVQCHPTIGARLHRARLVPFAQAGNVGSGALKVWIPRT